MAGAHGLRPRLSSSIIRLARNRNPPREARCFIPLTCSHISAQPVWVCVRCCTGGVSGDCVDRLPLDGSSRSASSSLARSHLPGQSGARTAELKPITRCFPPDPRSLPNGQVSTPACCVRAVTSSDQMLVVHLVSLSVIKSINRMTLKPIL